ncbi:MAG TPA: S41 family peptidase [Luteibaculaceae bacterium]|nr:S41 family peptidase [Luteibaculaceae bacterium]
MKPHKSVYLPLLLAATLVAGVYLGLLLSANADRQQINFITPNTRTIGGKLNQILNYIEDQYVDTIEKEKLAEKAINSLLADLDPHSYYIPAEELSDLTEPLEGNFDGIGVEFLIENDTIVVVNTVVGGPSESVGIQAGDRITRINGKLVAGTGIQNQDVMKYLRGPSGSKVKVDVIRNGKIKQSFSITRGKIPINSVDASLLINDTTGYIKISRFAKYTYEEFMTAVKDLQKARPQLKKLVIDLRNNGGGYLNSAIQMAEEFLPKGKLIVYTQGKSQPTRKYSSSRNGTLTQLQLDILVNESSASASEVFAGAMQDQDRATIIGRRTFGKGLVQEQMELPDRSALRLTVARYYTPTGRSIQKPYGKGIDYESDFEARFNSGELFSRDSIKVADSLKYRTPGGKIVYGGGGIVPDYFVPLDSTEQSLLLSSLMYTGELNNQAFDYVDANRRKLGKYKTAVQFVKEFKVDDRLYQSAMGTVLSDYSGTIRLITPQETRAIKLRLKALIARNLFGTEGYYAVMIPSDPMIFRKR